MLNKMTVDKKPVDTGKHLLPSFGSPWPPIVTGTDIRYFDRNAGIVFTGFLLYYFIVEKGRTQGCVLYNRTTLAPHNHFLQHLPSRLWVLVPLIVLGGSVPF